jgi:glycerophosphoryl diester phosphodiesterase
LRGHAPENTLAGIRRRCVRADAIEIDVHCTSMACLCSSDETVDRTTDGTATFTRCLLMSSARSMRAHAGSHRVPGRRYPRSPGGRSHEGQGPLQIEIKQAGIEEQIADVVRAADAIADCETHCFSAGVVRTIRGVEPRLAAALWTDGKRVVDWQDIFGFVLSLGAQGVSVYYSLATPEVVRMGQRRSLTFMTWTVDGEPDMELMCDAGVDSICSNFPDLVRKIVDARSVR